MFLYFVFDLSQGKRVVRIAEKDSTHKESPGLAEIRRSIREEAKRGK